MNRWNPKGLRRNHRGQLLDKWGRDMEIDWEEFDKKRLGLKDRLQYPKVLNPLHAAARPKRTAESLVSGLLESEDELSPEAMRGYIDRVKTGSVKVGNTTITMVVSRNGEMGVPTGGTRRCRMAAG